MPLGLRPDPRGQALSRTDSPAPGLIIHLIRPGAVSDVDHQVVSPTRRAKLSEEQLAALENLGGAW